MRNENDLIILHADDYFNRSILIDMDYVMFISYVKRNTARYIKLTNRVIFMERIALRIKQLYDRHLLHCSHSETGNCRFIKNYESVLFYIQYDLTKMRSLLSISELELIESRKVKARLKQILAHFNNAKVGRKINFNVFIKEMEDLKHYYYLNKKIWRHLLVGKITEMVGRKKTTEYFSKEVLVLADMIYFEMLSN